VLNQVPRHEDAFTAQPSAMPPRCIGTEEVQLLGTRRRSVITSTPRLSYRREKSFRHPPDRRKGGPQKTARTRCRRRKFPAPAGNRILVIQSVDWSLYWLSYPDNSYPGLGSKSRAVHWLCAHREGVVKIRVFF